MSTQTQGDGTQQAAPEGVKIEQSEETFEEVYADVAAALEDIDPDDTKALYARCEQILDDIHSGRF